MHPTAPNLVPNLVPQPKLVLHFDVNKTVVMSDAAGGLAGEAGTAAMVSSFISESAWGTVDPAPGTAPHLSFKLLSTAPSEHPPTAAAAAAPAAASGTIPALATYADIVEPLPRAERRALKTRFTDPGQPGEALRPCYEQCLAALRAPPEAAAQHPRLFSNGLHQLVPSFLTLAAALLSPGARATLQTSHPQLHAQLPPPAQIAFVFRTFGTDLPDIAEEWNLFCGGQHPMYPDVRLDGSEPGSRDHRLRLPADTGVLFRGPPTPGDPVGVGLAHVCPSNGHLTREAGAEAVFAAINSHLAQRPILGLSDDYHWWHAQGEADTAGKLLLVEADPPPASAADQPPYTHTRTRTRHVFWDDNIERDRLHIVDVRDTHSGRNLSFAEAFGRFAVRVQPIQAVLDPHYYLSSLASALDKLPIGH